MVSLLKAAQALASDRDPDSLIERMLRLLSENAGAERAVLVLSREGQLVVRAELSVEPERFTLYDGETLLGSALLPVSAVQYVARTQEPLVLGRDSGEGSFDGDPYLNRRRPASMLLVPLLHQGRLLGVMVLEHARTTDAFPEARVQIATLLAAQAATAVENTELYTELSGSHQRLEHLVEERTSELRAAKVAADRANHAKSDFLSSMSHELRTPLNGILGYTQILVKSSNLSAKEREGLNIIRRSGEHLLTLINDTLDLAKIEAGKMELIPRDVHLQVVIETVTQLCRLRAEQKEISFGSEHVGPLVTVVRVDDRRLMQVLLNLLGNAIKFTARGGRDAAHHRRRAARGRPRVALRDRGYRPRDLARGQRSNLRARSSRSATRARGPRAPGSGSRSRGRSSSSSGVASR